MVGSENNNLEGETKFSSSDSMKPHSEAKVTLYGFYLEKFLAILGVTEDISKINIFDVFCGTGVYKNGKYGSPIVAFNAIQKTKLFLSKIDKLNKPTTLTINDGNLESVNNAKAHLLDLCRKDTCCELKFHNVDAAEMIDNIINQIAKQPSSERNLVFIDPTGYKEIHRGDLYKLLKARRSEIILFLPISYMHRFKGVAQVDYDNPSYRHLRRFMSEFFDAVPPPIRMSESMSVHDFIFHTKEALRFKDFYVSSFFLQKESNTYALFFITPHILGLERAVDAKWEFDVEQGRGFTPEKKPSIQLDLFYTSAYDIRMQELEKLVKDYIKSNPDCNNRNLYEYVLNKEFRPTHAKQVLEKLHKIGVIRVWHIESKKETKSFYVNYKSWKTRKATVTYKLA